MTDNRRALAGLVIGLVIAVGGVIALQVYGGELDSPLLVGVALAQIVGIAIVLARVKGARMWLFGIGVLEIGAALMWLIGTPHSGGPPVTPPAVILPLGGHWSAVAIATGLLTIASAVTYRDRPRVTQ